LVAVTRPDNEWMVNWEYVGCVNEGVQVQGVSTLVIVNEWAGPGDWGSNSVADFVTFRTGIFITGVFKKTLST